MGLGLSVGELDRVESSSPPFSTLARTRSLALTADRLLDPADPSAMPSGASCCESAEAYTEDVGISVVMLDLRPGFSELLASASAAVISRLDGRVGIGACTRASLPKPLAIEYEPKP